MFAIGTRGPERLCCTGTSLHHPSLAHEGETRLGERPMNSGTLPSANFPGGCVR
jgi:hypothetical protein